MPKTDAIRITQRGVELVGTASPADKIRVSNRSLSPVGPSRARFVDQVVRADSRGRFVAVVPAGGEGDQVRVSRVGESKIWLTIRLEGLSSKDSRRPEVSLQGYRLIPSAKDELRFECLRAVQRIAEPLARVRLRNKRTGKAHTFQLDEDGRLPKNARLKGRIGDTFKVSITDGTHDTSLRQECGYICAVDPKSFANLEMPPMGIDVGDEDDTLKASRFRGPLFGQEISLDAPLQGATGNCWLVSIASAMAALDPQSIKNLVKPNKDGTYTVNFHRYEPSTKAYVQEKVVVDNKLYRNEEGLLYGSSRGPTSTGKMEMWWPILEKAYAKWKGSYDAIEWGYGHEAFESLLGAQGQQVNFEAAGEDGVWATLSQAQREKRPTFVTSTHRKPKELEAKGLVEDHAYTFLGVEERDGQRFVKLRNPWGHFEPQGDGKDDGIFSLSFKEFSKNFVSAAVGPKMGER